MKPSPQDVSDEEIKKKLLFQSAMKSKWRQVIKAYEKHQELHTAKITSSGDTALHIAISNDAKEYLVQKLVDVVSKTEGAPALAMQNELGNTPLHLAAYLGNANVCHCIATACSPEYFSRLMGFRNRDNETPFFLAVRHGNKDAFSVLHSISKEFKDDAYKYCRGKQGETILHSAIYGDYFDLAFDIMTHYPKLISAVNEQGVTALHILANKPSAFRSGSHIRGLDKFIYHYQIRSDQIILLLLLSPPPPATVTTTSVGHAIRFPQYQTIHRHGHQARPSSAFSDTKTAIKTTLA